MEIIVLKFGGSSLADNEKLKLVTNKIVDLYNKEYKIVVIVSAQGKTTDKLLSEAKELSNNINSRELDALISVGEQISSAKLSILLQELGYESISLTGWQAGIFTTNTNQDATIKHIDTKRILQELEYNKIVIITGFQGINEKLDITTIGRGGSDTSAVAIAASLNAKNCYIFSDVDGVYTLDPNKYDNATKLSALSYDEMLELSNEGAKVLHNRSIEIANKYKIPIITKSTFNNKSGTVISDIIEENTIKSIVKKDLTKVAIVGNGMFRNSKSIIDIFTLIDNEKLEILEFNISENKISIYFKNLIQDKFIENLNSIINKKI